ncbi:hypothetical protein BCR36DRAFT_358638 [Piromyces finnis]|uniref:Tubby C-terminal domain-containing protein n=1 Tax=Piromyces finnis TaxID=1754191 RepID=A0A1Y1V1G6_9FUNG|nr:hypothetical protein BCR36DRAFT_358638 [Piromyces finnis]|eukprot:ORX45192.1 hypothetical protein BCR36DRAFT_358638 [Piromyces finnis]
MSNNELIEYNKEISIPDHLISNVDFNYISKRHDVFYLRVSCSNYSNNSVIILNSEGEELYNCGFIYRGIIVYDNLNFPIINTFIQNSMKYFIYSGEDRNEILSFIKFFNSIELKKYEMFFFNKITNQHEVLTILFNETKTKYSVYCNRDCENETLICSFGIMKDTDFDFYIEVSPWVDYVQMFGIALCFYNLV